MVHNNNGGLLGSCGGRRSLLLLLQLYPEELATNGKYTQQKIVFTWWGRPTVDFTVEDQDHSKDEMPGGLCFGMDVDHTHHETSISINMYLIEFGDR